MISFERTFDYNLVWAIATHPKVYPHVSDDFSPKPEDYKPPESDSILYLLCKDGDEVLGMWTLIPENGICWQVHTCLLPNAYGPRAAKAVKLATEWVWRETQCLRIVTNVPEYNRLALMFALKAGMTRYGINPKSFMKDGHLHDQVLLGITKPSEGK